jgi:hypothetical protein
MAEFAGMFDIMGLKLRVVRDGGTRRYEYMFRF